MNRQHVHQAIRKWLVAGFTLLGFLFLAGAGPAAYGDPPPWAPAHGYYKDKKKKRKMRGRDLDAPATGYIVQGRCNREAIGKVLGGIIGGVAGSRVGKGDGKTLAIIAGTLIGYYIGGSIGRSMDDADRHCIGQALEYAGDRQSVTWNNPDTGAVYTGTPERTYQAGGRYCREFSTRASIGGKPGTLHQTACRGPDGAWTITPQ